MAQAETHGGTGNPLIYLSHHDHYTDAVVREVLSRVGTIAMVGASGDWKRPSYYAMKYLQKKGYRVLPVNPTRAGDQILGETVYASIADVPQRIDMVDVFRNAEVAMDVTRQTIAAKEDKGISVLWMQLDVRNDKAAALAETAGLTVIMNRCPKIEFGRLSGELGWCGINTGIISAKRLKPLRA